MNLERKLAHFRRTCQKKEKKKISHVTLIFVKSL